MDLFTYRETNGISQKGFARIVGVSPSCICQIEKGLRRASPVLALAIEKATGGAVTRLELLYPDEVHDVKHDASDLRQASAV